MTTQQAIIVVGLGYGDENKGGTIDYLTRLHQAHTIIRYNGGSQAAHNVITVDGRHHTFAQFGSGTFVPGVQTHLSNRMLVNPFNLLREEQHLRQLGVTDALGRLTIDGQAPLITPFQVATNRLREIARGGGRHGSCGQGIGETMSDLLSFGDISPRVTDLNQPKVLRQKLRRLQELKRQQLADVLAWFKGRDQAIDEQSVLCDPEIVEVYLEHYQQAAKQLTIVDSAWLQRRLTLPGTVLFEGAQGVLLDEWRGFHPYTTWSTTTSANAEALLTEAGYPGQVIKLGLVRAYGTRHGAGPFMTEDDHLSVTIPEPHNGNNDWQHQFRAGYFDAVAIRYAIEVNGGVDCLAVSHVDVLAQLPKWQICQNYHLESPPNDVDRFFDVVDRKVSRIKLGQFQDLDHQARLTELLEQCRPVYQPMAKTNTTDYLRQLAQSLGVPIGIISTGPTAADKHPTANWRDIVEINTLPLAA